MESWRFLATQATVAVGLQLYAKAERLSGATANKKEDRAHVIVLVSAVTEMRLILAVIIHFCFYVWI